jgi:hypothetical protein
MSRWLLSLAAVLTVTSAAQASLHQFICNEQFSRNKITLVGNGMFELQDAPVNGNQYPAVNPLQITVDALQGTLQFSLLRVTTLQDQIAMVFAADPALRLFMTFDVAGINNGDPLPGSWQDDDGIVEWNTNNQLTDPTGDPLRGSKNAVVAAVPEPSAFGFGAIALGLAGCGRYVRRRFFLPAA